MKQARRLWWFAEAFWHLLSVPANSVTGCIDGSVLLPYREHTPLSSSLYNTLEAADRTDKARERERGEKKRLCVGCVGRTEHIHR